MTCEDSLQDEHHSKLDAVFNSTQGHTFGTPNGNLTHYINEFVCET